MPALPSSQNMAHLVCLSFGSKIYFPLEFLLLEFNFKRLNLDSYITSQASGFLKNSVSRICVSIGFELMVYSLIVYRGIVYILFMSNCFFCQKKSTATTSCFSSQQLSQVWDNKNIASYITVHSARALLRLNLHATSLQHVKALIRESQ